MSILLPSEIGEFASELQTEINSNPSQSIKMDDWGVDFNGDLLLHAKPDEVYDGDDIYVFLEMENEVCKDISILENEEDREYGFAYRGTYSQWKNLLTNDSADLEPLLDGSFSLDGGLDLFRNFRWGLFEIAKSAQQIEVEFEY